MTCSTIRRASLRAHVRSKVPKNALPSAHGTFNDISDDDEWPTSSQTEQNRTSYKSIKNGHPRSQTDFVFHKLLRRYNFRTIPLAQLWGFAQRPAFSLRTLQKTQTFCKIELLAPNSSNLGTKKPSGENSKNHNFGKVSNIVAKISKAL